jgi:hypothetical protein
MKILVQNNIKQFIYFLKINNFVKKTKPCNVGLCKRHRPQKDKLVKALNRAYWGLGGVYIMSPNTSNCALVP